VRFGLILIVIVLGLQTACLEAVEEGQEAQSVSKASTSADDNMPKHEDEEDFIDEEAAGDEDKEPY